MCIVISSREATHRNMPDHNNRRPSSPEVHNSSGSSPSRSPEPSPDWRPWAVVARTVLLAVDVAAISWLLSFVNKIEGAFSDNPSEGRSMQYIWAVISAGILRLIRKATQISLAIFIDLTGPILTVWGKLNNGSSALLVVVDLASGILGVVSSAMALGNDKFIYKVEKNSVDKVYPTMRDRKNLVGLLLTVAAMGDDGEDLPPPWTPVEAAPKRDYQKSSLRQGVYLPRLALLVFDMAALGYMVWYVSLIFDPWGEEKTYNDDNITDRRYLFGFAAVAAAILFDLTGACAAYFSHKYPSKIDALVCISLLDLFPGILGTASWVIHGYSGNTIFRYHEGSRYMPTTYHYICEVRVPDFDTSWCIKEIPSSVVERFAAYQSRWIWLVIALAAPPKYSTFDAEASQPPSYEMEFTSQSRPAVGSTASSQHELTHSGQGAPGRTEDGHSNNRQLLLSRQHSRAVHLLIGVQASTPPTPSQIRERQDRHIYWLGSNITSNGKASEIAPQWKDNANRPTVDRVHMLLARYENKGIFKIPTSYRVSYFDGGSFSMLFKISTEAPWVHAQTGKTVPQDVLFRVPCTWAPFYGTESEVATMTYVAQKAGILTPEIYFFDSSAANPLGWEFTVMQLLDDAQPMCDSPNRDRFTDDQIMAQWRKLWNLDFAQSGSLYCNWDTDKSFFVGPMVHVEFFGPSRRPDMKLVNVGPFKTWEEYALALIDARSDRNWSAVRAASHGAGPMDVDVDMDASAAGDAASAFMGVDGPGLRAAVQEVSLMMDDFSGEAGLAFKPRMTHHDMHRGNILVRKGDFVTVAAIIDWEGVRIEPAGLIQYLVPKAIPTLGVSEDRARKMWLLPDEFYADKPREAREKIINRLEEI
ncbi:hypothetical protein QBC44DRAFT_357451 [Cladorrhinum sp. PSN332]|nr:hypothetical protein QBC44DRAFT_357451 [Cladorrhinum sp. PSN332]